MSANYFLNAPPLKQADNLLSLRINHLLVYFERKNRAGAKAMELKQFDPARSLGALESSSF
jgi:hypothetical protein